MSNPTGPISPHANSLRGIRRAIDLLERDDAHPAAIAAFLRSFLTRAYSDANADWNAALFEGAPA